MPAALVECRLDALAQSGEGVGVGAARQAVDEDVDLETLQLVVGHGAEQVGYVAYVATDADAGESLLEFHLKLLAHGAPLWHGEGALDGETAALVHLEDIADHVLNGVALDFLSADGRDGLAGAGKEHAQIVVDLGGGAYGGALAAVGGALLDGYGGGNAVDIVALGLLQAAHKLAGIAGEALHIAALAVGEEGVEGKARLAAAAEAGDDHKFAAGYGDVNALEIVDAYAFCYYVTVHDDLI